MTSQLDHEPMPDGGRKGSLEPASRSQRRGLSGLLVVVSLAFFLLLTPLLGPVLWAIAITLLFYPVHLALGRRTRLPANAMAAVSLTVIVLTIVLPTLLVATLLTGEASAVLGRLDLEGVELATIVSRLSTLQPDWLAHILGAERWADPRQAQVWVAGIMNTALRGLIASAPGLGQLAFGYLIDLAVMLYLTFFLLRDGMAIARAVEQSLPLAPDIRQTLLTELVSVVRATLKSSFAIAVLQGTLGGIVFYGLDIRAPALWGTAMGFMSLLPTIGTGVVWVPVALYLLATGAIWQSLTLAFCGLFVIGTVDNFVRPMLIGRSSHIPNVTVFLATIGGLGLFGVNGIIIGPLVACLFTVSWRIRHTHTGD